MKYLLLIAIRMYWLLWPARFRGVCLFRESCSHFVYRCAVADGVGSGIRALRHRMNVCKPGAQLFFNPSSGQVNMILGNGEVLQEEDISKRLLKDRYH